MPVSPMLQIIAFALKFSKEGINVVTAADRITQIPMKQALFQHAADWEHACIICLKVKTRTGNSPAEQ